jgi:NADH dehydrogenase
MAETAGTQILIVGGGTVGMNAALRLQRRLRNGEASITVVDPQPHMTYQPFLPEAAAGSIEPRHVVVPLRTVLRHCRVLTGRVTAIEHARRLATVQTTTGEVEQISYDLLVVVPGSVSRTLPIPGD